MNGLRYGLLITALLVSFAPVEAEARPAKKRKAPKKPSRPSPPRAAPPSATPRAAPPADTPRAAPPAATPRASPPPTPPEPSAQEEPEPPAAPPPRAPAAAARPAKSAARPRAAPPADAPPADDGGNRLTWRYARPSSLRIFSLAVELGLGNRRLEGTAPTATNPVVPLVGFRADLYLLAPLRVRFLPDLSIVAELAHSLYGRTRFDNGREVDHRWLAFGVGLHQRFRTGKDPRLPVVGVFTLYGGQDFTYAQNGLLATESPSVEYRFVRLGADLRIPAGPAAITLGAAYRGVVSAGYLGDRVPLGAVNGVDVFLGLGLWLGRGFVAQVGAEYTRYLFGGVSDAFDELVSGRLGVSWAI